MKRAAAWLLALIVVWAAWTAWQTVRFANTALTSPEAQSAEASGDGVIVLGAAVRGEDPSPVFASRLDHGIALVQSGRAPLLFLTGGTRDSSVLAESEVGKQYALTRGIAPEAIRREDISRTTAQNLACIQPLVEASGAESVLLVSDPLHLRRASMLARDADLTVVASATLTSRYQSWRTKGPFLAREVWFSGLRLLALPFGPVNCPEG